MIFRIKDFLFLTVILSTTSILFIIWASESHVRIERSTLNGNIQPEDERKQSKHRAEKVSYQEILDSKRIFNMSGHDLFILLHIQKTGGTTFERHLVHDLEMEQNCSCSEENRRCHCPRPTANKRNITSIADSTWLISRFSTGWLCGLHADWTQLDICLTGLRNLFFLTNLRHPLSRFVSEYRHVKRGATWKNSRSHCKNLDTQFCYNNQSSWLNVSLSEFSGCINNTAINRQTRMLANHRLIDSCPSGPGKNSTMQSEAMLSSAKKNLKELAFFGICEKQEASQLLFERTFGMRFKITFKQSDDDKTTSMIDRLSSEVKDDILRLNHLDLELYNYALDLFNQRTSIR